ncbi:MAG: PAS domain S-box protein [Promethearchaeota archaeon]
MKKKQSSEFEILRMIQDQTIMGIFIVQDNRIIYANKGAEEIYGYPFEETKNWGIKDILKPIHHDDREFVLEQLRKKQYGEMGTVANYRYRIISKTGVLKTIELFSKTIAFNKKSADLVTVIDVTKENLYKEKLLESEKKYREAYQRVEFLNDLFAHDINNILQKLNYRRNTSISFKMILKKWRILVTSSTSSRTT